MGGIMKGGYAVSAYSSRRKWMNVYVAMAVLCLVFGCGILGVMGVNRLKERRFLNVLLKQKDDQILSLRQLLQKEREEMQEIKRKREEMKMKIYRLAAQKTELNGRVLEMQSVISSLRDEGRAIESAYQEIQNEAKSLRDQIQDQKALTQALQHKDAQIQDLKQQLQLKGGVEDERSILPENSTARENVSANNTITNEIDKRNMHDEQQQHREDDGRSISGKEELEKSSGNGRSEQAVTEVEKKENETDKIRDKDGEAEFTDSKEFQTGLSKNDVHKGLVKLEMQENSHRYKVKRLKGKRWRAMAKQSDGKTSWQSNGASTIRNQATDKGVEEIGNKPRNLDEYQNSLQKEPVSKGAVQGEESNGEGNGQSIIKPEEDKSHIAGKQNMSRISVDEQSKEQESNITDVEKDDNGHRLRQNEAAEDADGMQMESLEESDNEQTNKPDFEFT